MSEHPTQMRRAIRRSSLTGNALVDDPGLSPKSTSMRKEKQELINGRQSLPIEDYTELDSLFVVLRDAAFIVDHPERSFNCQDFVEWMVKEDPKQRAPDKETAMKWGQRLLDTDLIASITGGSREFEETEHRYILTVDASCNPESPKFSLSTFYYLKRDPTTLHGDLLVRGKHYYSKVYAVISRHDFVLFIFRSKESVNPRRAVQLRDVASCSVETDEHDLPELHLKMHDDAKEIVADTRLVVDDWDMAQQWLEFLTKPRISVSHSDNLRMARANMMATRKKFMSDANPAQLPNLSRLSTPVAYRAGQEKASPRVSEDEQPVKLQVTLDTPQYHAALKEYMERNYCSESLNFLEAVFAFKQLFSNRTAEGSVPSSLAPQSIFTGTSKIDDAAHSEREALRKKTHAIFSEFLAPTAPQMVNVDSKTFKIIERRMNGGKYHKNIFNEAWTAVFNMVERDVYRRFVTSDAYKKMLDPSAVTVPEHERKKSFSLIATEEDVKELERIAKKFSEQSSSVKSRRYRLRKYEQCFKGSQLIDWLLEERHVHNRSEGLALGQRMRDAGILQHVTDQHDFEDVDHLFYTLEGTSGSNGPSPQELMVNGRDNIFSCDILLRGVRYIRVHAIIAIKDKMLYLYRNRVTTSPLSCISLKGAVCEFVQQKHDADISYATLTCKHPQRTLTFRIEDHSLRKDWSAALMKASVDLKPYEIESLTLVRTHSF